MRIRALPPRHGRGHERRTPVRELPNFTHLPEPVRPETMVTTQQVTPPPDPEGGRNTEQDFVLRYAG